MFFIFSCGSNKMELMDLQTNALEVILENLDVLTLLNLNRYSRNKRLIKLVQNLLVRKGIVRDLSNRVAIVDASYQYERLKPENIDDVYILSQHNELVEIFTGLVNLREKSRIIQLNPGHHGIYILHENGSVSIAGSGKGRIPNNIRNIRKICNGPGDPYILTQNNKIMHFETEIIRYDEEIIDFDVSFDISIYILTQSGKVDNIIDRRDSYYKQEPDPSKVNLIGTGRKRGQIKRDILPNTKVVAIAAMRNLCVMLSDDGKVYNYQKDRTYLAFEPKNDGKFAVGIAGQSTFSLILLNNGEVIANTGTCIIPPTIQMRTILIKAGYKNAAAVLDDGTLVVWQASSGRIIADTFKIF
jgi:hypothetical protein